MTTLSDPLAASQAQRGRLGFLLAAFGLLLAPLALLADKAVVPLVLATVLIGGLLVAPSVLIWRTVDRGMALGAGLLTAWCLLASLWSPQPLAAAGLALRVGLLLFALLYLVGLVLRLDAAQRARVTRCFGLGLGITVALIAVEFAFGTPVFDLLRGRAEDAYGALSRLNRGVSAVVILVWPLAAYAWQRGRRPLALALPPALFAVALFSQSSASMLALGAGLLAAALSGFGRRAARLVMAAAVVGALFGSPFAAEIAQRSGLAEAAFLPETGSYRLHVWKVVTQRITERPVFGWGFDASNDLPTGDAQPFRPGTKVIPSHPHNGALQVMVELGLLGSLLIAGWLFVIAARIDRLAPVPRTCAVAMMVTTLGIACTAYGIWQSHWLAIIGSAGVIFATLAPYDNAAAQPD